MGNKCVFWACFLNFVKLLRYKAVMLFFRISASHNICDTLCKITFGPFILKMQERLSFRNLSHGKKTCSWLGFNNFQ